LFVPDYTRNEGIPKVLPPWYEGTCDLCDIDDYVIATRSQRALCLECFSSTGDMPIWDGRYPATPRVRSANGRFLTEEKDKEAPPRVRSANGRFLTEEKDKRRDA
jgi:hypothetical protein